MQNMKELSEAELASMIENAQLALRDKQAGKRKTVIAQIKDLAASIGVHVEFSETAGGSSRKGTTVPVKYRDPENPLNQWTGRGMRPRWLREKIEQGKTLESYEI